MERSDPDYERALRYFSKHICKNESSKTIFPEYYRPFLGEEAPLDRTAIVNRPDGSRLEIHSPYNQCQECVHAGATECLHLSHPDFISGIEEYVLEAL